MDWSYLIIPSDPYPRDKFGFRLLL
jgi:hypothetical protein